MKETFIVRMQNGIVTLIDTTGQTKWVYQSDNCLYYAKDGVLLVNTLEEIDGSYYYFNELGKMVQQLLIIIIKDVLCR